MPAHSWPNWLERLERANKQDEHVHPATGMTNRFWLAVDPWKALIPSSLLR